MDPTTADQAANRLIARHDPAPFLAILEILVLASPPLARNARELAHSLARAARLVRVIIHDQCRAGPSPELADLQSEFRETLFAHPEAGGYDSQDEAELFATAFAQTLAFGLLLARESSHAEIDRHAYHLLAPGSYPLLRATLRALTQDEILDVLAFAFDIVQDTVNSCDPAHLARRGDADPILYFYEDFLSVFDPNARRRHGVFFTPVPIVRFMINAVDAALRTRLSTNGLLDPNVLLLDPACGTATFLVAALAYAADQIRNTMGEGALAGEMANLAARLHGLELLVGPYTVAHYRMLRELTANGVVPTQQLPIYLADTLAPPGGAKHVTGRLGFLSRPIVQERENADRLKGETPILAIIGNPPYRRMDAGEERALTSAWDNGFWDDLKKPVRDAGWGNELNTFPDRYVAFWRWALWKLFESEGAPKRGVVCMITNRTFLAGHPYAGLRQMLRHRFDHIDIVDLRGDLRGSRPAGITQDEGVFAIQTGVCILTAVATGKRRSASADAAVTYADAWREAAFTEQAKLRLLDLARSAHVSLDASQVMGSSLADLVPAAFEGLSWPSLPDVFTFLKSGLKTQRDRLVYGFSSSQVRDNIKQFVAEADAQAQRLFFPRSDDENGRINQSEMSRFSNARKSKFDKDYIRQCAYRPLDLREIYYHPSFISRPGPELVAAFGARNICLYAMPSGTGAGPAAWAHALLPDYHAFRGSYGGYAFPLWDRRNGPNSHNLRQPLLDRLSTLYAHRVTPQQIFNTIAALLSATSYTSRFAWDLQDTFARIPFPASAETFLEAARIGHHIVELETFSREPAEPFRTARLLGRATGLTLEIPTRSDAFHQDGTGSGFVPLLTDESLKLAHIPERVWTFAVSGYRVLPRWLAARNGQALDAALHRAVLDLTGRIAELLHWFDTADPILAAALERPLTASELGLPIEPPTR